MAALAEPPQKRARGGEERNAEALNKCIVLVGMRAAGKSTFGKAACEHFGCKFVDMDVVLEEEVFGCKCGPYVDKHGWPKFREAEAQLLEDILIKGSHLGGCAGSIVATGGGVVETPAAFEFLKKHCAVVLIDRHIDDICRDLEGGGSYRPALGSSPREVYARRQSLYKECSDYVLTIQKGAANWVSLQRRFAHLLRWANAGGASQTLANTICVPIVAPTLESACADIYEAASEGAGLVELRLDKLAGSVETVRAALPVLLGTARKLGLPVLATFRPKWEDPGSSYVGEEGPRLQVQRLAAELGAAFIDVEFKATSAFSEGGGLPAATQTRLVVSSHDFSRLWEMDELRSLTKEMRSAAGPRGIVKVAQMPRSSAEAARMLTVLQESGGGDTVALAMGEAGVFTRLLAPRFGATFTFGCLSGRASAPGQPSVSEMIEVYRLGSATAKTKIYGQLGAAAGGVELARAFNAGFAAEDWDAVYLPLPLLGSSLQEFIASLPHCLAGASIAREQGPAALEFATESDDASRKHGIATILVVPSDTPGCRWYRASAPGFSDVTSDCVASVLAEYAAFRGAVPASAVAEAVRAQLAK